MNTKPNGRLHIIKLLISGAVWMLAFAVFSNQWLGLGAFGVTMFILSRSSIFRE